MERLRRSTCFKTENFTFTGSRDLNKAQDIDSAADAAADFPPAKASHLVGIGDYTTSVAEGSPRCEGAGPGIGGAVRTRPILLDWVSGDPLRSIFAAQPVYGAIVTGCIAADLALWFLFSRGSCSERFQALSPVSNVPPTVFARSFRFSRPDAYGFLGASRYQLST